MSTPVPSTPSKVSQIPIATSSPNPIRTKPNNSNANNSGSRSTGGPHPYAKPPPPSSILGAPGSGSNGKGKAKRAGLTGVVAPAVVKAVVPPKEAQVPAGVKVDMSAVSTPVAPFEADDAGDSQEVAAANGTTEGSTAPKKKKKKSKKSKASLGGASEELPHLSAEAPAFVPGHPIAKEVEATPVVAVESAPLVQEVEATPALEEKLPVVEEIKKDVAPTPVAPEVAEKEEVQEKEIDFPLSAEEVIVGPSLSELLDVDEALPVEEKVPVVEAIEEPVVEESVVEAVVEEEKIEPAVEEAELEEPVADEAAESSVLEAAAPASKVDDVVEAITSPSEESSLDVSGKVESASTQIPSSDLPLPSVSYAEVVSEAVPEVIHPAVEIASIPIPSPAATFVEEFPTPAEAVEVEAIVPESAPAAIVEDKLPTAEANASEIVEATPGPEVEVEKLEVPAVLEYSTFNELAEEHEAVKLEVEESAVEEPMIEEPVVEESPLEEEEIVAEEPVVEELPVVEETTPLMEEIPAPTEPVVEEVEATKDAVSPEGELVSEPVEEVEILEEVPVADQEPVEPMSEAPKASELLVEPELASQSSPTETPSLPVHPESTFESLPTSSEDASPIINDDEDNSSNRDSSPPPPDPPVTEPPSLTLSLANTWNNTNWAQRIPALMASIAINFGLPFVNGVMLGFGELFARNVIGIKLGWGNPYVAPGSESTRANTTSGSNVGVAGASKEAGSVTGAGKRTALEAVVQEGEAIVEAARSL